MEPGITTFRPAMPVPEESSQRFERSAAKRRTREYASYPVSSSARHWLGGIAVGAASVVAVTLAIAALDSVAPVLSLGVLYVFAVLLVAVFWGPQLAVPVAVASMLAFNFFFLEPLYTFTLADRQNWIVLIVYVVTAVVVGVLASRYRLQRAEAEQRERESALLADIAVELLRGTELEHELARIEERTAAVLDVSSVRIALGDVPSMSGREAPHPLSVDGRALGTLYLPETEEPDLATQRRLLPALASLLGIAREREQLQRDAVEAEALRHSDIVKTAVIQSVSHDLRTPLATIEQALDGLQSGELALTDEDRAALLDAIRVEHSRLKRLVENLLDLSRLQAQAMKPRPDVWSPAELVGGALDDVQGAERVQVTAPPNGPSVRVDATQRALANLLENALRVSPEGEPVHVRITATRKDVLIRVTDHGPGVPEPEREKVFEPFHRVRDRADERGAGLGLAIARGFVQANGGRLWLESRDNQGASFVVALPVVEVREPDASAPMPA
jgi:two-component system sensor histidine kinase KdpD